MVASILNWFFLFLFPCFFSYLDVQIIIQNLTTYNVYTVNVQAASSSIINPRRILLGSHSASRKVSHTYVQQEYEFLIHLQELCSCSCVCEKALILIFYTTTTAGIYIECLDSLFFHTHAIHSLSCILCMMAWFLLINVSYCRERCKKGTFKNDVGDFGNKSNVSRLFYGNFPSFLFQQLDDKKDVSKA